MATPKDQFKEGEKAAEDFTKKVQEEVAYLRDAFVSLGEALASSFRNGLDGVSELDTASQRVAKRFSREILNSVNKVNISLDKQLSIQEKINKGADVTKELSKERQKIEENQIAIKSRIAVLEANGVTNLEEQKAELEEQFTISKDIVRSLEKQNKERNDALGITGKLASGLDGILKRIDKTGSLSKVLDIESAVTKTTRYARQAGKGATGFKKAAVFTKSLGKNLISNVKSIDLVSLGAAELFSAITKSDKATGELAKGFNMSYSAASNLRKDLAVTANLSNDVNVNIAGLQESMMAVGKTLGSNVKLNQQDLVTFTKLREQAGMTNEELASMQRLTLATGGTLEDNTGEFLAQAQITAQNNGVVLNTKQLMTETANVSDAIKLSLGGSAGELAKAAAQAKSLGMSLDQVDKISESLLNFESSINAELEAELLTGKNLTLEKARQAALNGDLATVGAEISRQIGDSAEFAKMNRIQQEALAKSVGMTREDLAKTLMEREALAGLSAEEAKAGKATFDALVDQYGVEEAQKRLKEEGLENLMAQQSVSERFNKGIEKLRDSFMALAQPILDIVSPLLDLVNTILPAINFLLSPLVEGFSLIGRGVNMLVQGLKEAQPLAIALSVVLAGMARKQIAAAIAGIFSSLSQIPFGAGLLLAGAAVAGLISLISKSSSSIEDGMISPDGGLVVSGKKGTYTLDKNDTVVAGTGLGQAVESTGTAAGGGAGPSINMAPVVAELQAMKTVLTQILNKEGAVYIDSTKAGTAFAVGTSKLGS